MNNTLIVVIGPTAIGKTALGIALAKYYGSEIISCDSRQFFKEMKIGTAVPSEQELLAAEHHFIQNKTIFNPYSVGDFETESLELLNNLFKKNPVQIMVGGSGLYVDAVLKGFDQFPEINSEVRRKIQSDYQSFGLEYLKCKLKQLDPMYFDYIEQNNPQTFQNPQRMMRFVEVSEGTGKPYSAFLNQKSNTRNFKPILIGIQAPKEILHQRIEQRVDLMVAQGLLHEAKQLYPYKEKNALQTVGYRELFSFFDGLISLDTAIEQIKQNTKKFAKRQITWFKRYQDVIWVDYDAPKQKIIEEINKLM